jgi:UDP-glucose 4-epimerase
MVEKVAGRKINTILAPRRAGDPPALVARATRVRSVLQWTPRLDDLGEIIRSSYAWEQKLLAEPWK